MLGIRRRPVRSSRCTTDRLPLGPGRSHDRLPSRRLAALGFVDRLHVASHGADGNVATVEVHARRSRRRSDRWRGPGRRTSTACDRRARPRRWRSARCATPTPWASHSACTAATATPTWTRGCTDPAALRAWLRSGRAALGRRRHPRRRGGRALRAHLRPRRGPGARGGQARGRSSATAATTWRSGWPPQRLEVARALGRARASGRSASRTTRSARRRSRRSAGIETGLLIGRDAGGVDHGGTGERRRWPALAAGDVDRGGRTPPAARVHVAPPHETLLAPMLSGAADSTGSWGPRVVDPGSGAARHLRSTARRAAGVGRAPGRVHRRRSGGADRP